MKFDPYSGDYGPNFFGHAWATGTYVAEDPEFGWLAFGEFESGTTTTVLRRALSTPTEITTQGLVLRISEPTAG